MAGLAGLSSCSKDDEPAPRARVSFERSTRTISEGDGVVSINLLLDAVATEDFTVTYTVDGTAREGSPSVAGTDYQITSDLGKTKIKKGQANGVIELRIKNDLLFEGDETVELKITSVSSAHVDIDTDATMKITLADNDAEARVAFASPAQVVNEDDGVIEVKLVLDSPAPANMVFSYRVGGTATVLKDYAMEGTGGVRILEGQTEGQIRIHITDDKVYETADETVQLSLDAVDADGVLLGEVDKFTLTIQDDEREVVASFIYTPFAVEESHSLISVVVKLSTAPGADVKIQYQLSGSALDSVSASAINPAPSHDYAVKNAAGKPVLPGELVIPAGQTSGVIMIDPSSDYLFENEETVVIDLRPADGYKLQGAETYTGRILQEDGKAIALFWSATYGTVDMDLVLWELDPQSHQVIRPLTIANYPSFDGVELIFFPTTMTSKIAKASFGLSYIYYLGATEPMAFDVEFIDCVGITAEEPEFRDIFTGQYTLKNLNRYTTFADMKIEQTFDIVNGAYTNYSAIVTPAEGSRTASRRVSLPGSVRKNTSTGITPVLRRK